MSAAIVAAVQDSPIVAADEFANLRATEPTAAGASVFFVGAVRGNEVLAMTLEHYPGMTETALQNIAETATQQWQLFAVRIIHRIGRMLPGEIIVFVGASSKHRANAFAACAYMTDCLKTDAPFWKKEETANGNRWVKAAPGDIQTRRT